MIYEKVCNLIIRLIGKDDLELIELQASRYSSMNRLRYSKTKRSIVCWPFFGVVGMRHFTGNLL